jgi:hypothetical protein
MLAIVNFRSETAFFKIAFTVPALNYFKGLDVSRPSLWPPRKKSAVKWCVTALSLCAYAWIEFHTRTGVVQDALTKLGARASSLEDDLAKANLQITSQKVQTCAHMRVWTVEIKSIIIASRNQECCRISVFMLIVNTHKQLQRWPFSLSDLFWTHACCVHNLIFLAGQGWLHNYIETYFKIIT